MDEKEACLVCTETLNKATHKKTGCCYCRFECCHRCVQKYILSQIQDPHCMNCKKIWSREFLDDKLPKQFINTDLKTHREHILFEKEKNLLPETQDNVKLVIQQEEFDREMKSIETEIDTLQRRYEDIEKRKNDINPFHIIPRKTFQINRIPCPGHECRGFLEEHDQTLQCGICGSKVCLSCREMLRDGHTCSNENLKTIRLLDKDTKRCPSCAVQIFKINGCDQMWCISCHIAFDWKTGETVRGIIHNPHYHEYIEQHGVQHTRQEESYHRFQFMDTDLISRILMEQGCNELTMYQLIEVYRYVIHYYEVDLQRLPTRFDQRVNLDLRIYFLQNQLSEEEFKVKLQRRQKDTEKKIEYRDIGETYVEIMNDIFISFLENRSLEGLIADIHTVTRTTQEAIANLNKRYNSNMALVRTLL